ncbi:MAG: NUDIX domain-containing protein [Nanoarchaeota archaeon]
MKGEKFYVRIIGIVFDPNKKKILIGKNKKDKNYSFVDGKLNYGKDLNESLKKIIKEKTGYYISNLGSIFAGVKKKEELAIYFLCEIKEGREELGKGVKEIRWVKSDEIENLINEKLPKKLKEYIGNIAG